MSYSFCAVRAISICLASLSLIGCTSDIDMLTDKSKTVPVVFALINPWDSVHSIRVQRSFLIRDKEGAKLQDSDSLYFEKVDIRMAGLVDGVERFGYDFEKTFVDKDSGDFTGEGHHVYQLKQKLPIELIGGDELNPGRPDIHFLAFTIYIHDLDTLINHQIPVFSHIIIRNSPISKKIVIYGYKTTSFSLLYRSGIGSRKLYSGQSKFLFHISEYGEGFGYDTVYSYKGTPNLDKPEFFYNRILMSLQNSPKNVRTRVFHTMDVQWTLTDSSYSEFNRDSKYWQGNLDYPYGQIPGTYGFIVPKIYGELNGLVLDRRTMDTLCNGEKWKHLKFRSW